MADQYAIQEAVKPKSELTNHNQSVPDPIAHFKAIPWCAKLIEDRANIDVVVPDRRPLDSGESNFVRKTMNTPTTIKASISFLRPVKAHRTIQTTSGGELSKSTALLSGGGPDHSENPRNPFLLFNALADLGVDCQSYAGTMHGGLYTVLMDEVMGTAANFQAANGAYTVRFTTNFRRPVRMPQVVLVRGRVIKREGRKLHLRGSMEDKNGEVLAEAEGIWLCMAANVGRSQL
ncbi:alcohol dehydrogenase [Apiospora arundinis]|uniref:HotDog domain-containing protein n=1 Tax=Apiospora arundinis TaxID=335852 RepID=A0ABR2IX32_9PEZI